MKRIFSSMAVLATAVLILTLAMLEPAAAQAKKKPAGVKLPAAVQQAFTKAYPHAKILATSTEKEGGKLLYEVESMDGKQRRDLLYASDGTAVEVEEQIAPDALPAAVRTALEKEYPKCSIRKAETTTKNNATSYEMVIEHAKKEYEVVVDPSGKIVKCEMMKTAKAKKSKEAKEQKEEQEESDED